jgi:hypothetical protein
MALLLSVTAVQMAAIRELGRVGQLRLEGEHLEAIAAVTTQRGSGSSHKMNPSDRLVSAL